MVLYSSAWARAAYAGRLMGISDPTQFRSARPLDQWRELLRAQFATVSIEAAEPELTGSLTKLAIPGGAIWRVSSGPQVFRRAWSGPNSRIRPAVMLAIQGSIAMAQADVECELESGEFAFVDGAAPHRIAFRSEVEAIAVMFPPQAFAGRVFKNVVARRMEAEHPLNAPMYNCVINLWEALSRSRSAASAKGAAALVPLSQMTTAFLKADRDAALPVRVRKAMAFIEKRLADPDLSAEQVAADQGVSRRYLDSLFTAAGASVETWIWERRLQRAAAVLRVSTGMECNILQVALSHGFKTPSHFSRTFTRRFGRSPSAYRLRQDVAP